MITAQELRIGNYVNINGAILFLTPALFSLIITGEVAKPNPIPLSPEILEKCGFDTTTQNNDGSFNMWGKGIDASIDIEEGEVYKYRIHERNRTKQVMYLHQLQNLYYALTGTELEVKL